MEEGKTKRTTWSKEEKEMEEGITNEGKRKEVARVKEEREDRRG